MRWRGGVVLAALVATGVAAAAAPPEDAVKQEQQRFQGVWKVLSLEVGGAKRSEQEFSGWRLVIVADVMSAKDGDKPLGESTYKLDVGKEPRAIDISYIRG